jgi:hypothetical protein
MALEEFAQKILIELACMELLLVVVIIKLFSIHSELKK